MIRCLATLLVLFVCSILTCAQNSPPPQHQHAVTATDTIDGAVHPELIPESLAYRLYFVAVSTGPNPTDTERKRQQLFLSKIGLEENDHQILVSVLSDFKTKYDALVSAYNESAKAALAQNQFADIAGFMKTLEGLVQSTRDRLAVQLSTRSLSQLHTFVMSEKKNMKVQL
jgi:hypothetical protein